MMTARIYLLFLLMAAVGQSLAFSSVAKCIRPPTAVMASRRAFLLDVPLASAAAAMVAVSAPAFADNDDLAMPTAEEIEEEEKKRKEERLKRKAELQKKASNPKSYSASLQGEMAKQKDLRKSKEEMRVALCEELGRGC